MTDLPLPPALFDLEQEVSVKRYDRRYDKFRMRDGIVAARRRGVTTWWYTILWDDDESATPEIAQWDIQARGQEALIV